MVMENNTEQKDRPCEPSHRRTSRTSPSLSDRIGRRATGMRCDRRSREAYQNRLGSQNQVVPYNTTELLGYRMALPDCQLRKAIRVCHCPFKVSQCFGDR
jgi:hypothetical protein